MWPWWDEGGKGKRPESEGLEEVGLGGWLNWLSWDEGECRVWVVNSDYNTNADETWNNLGMWVLLPTV